VPGAGVKTLNKRIRSVKSTQQITKAMKMVAAAKLNRSQGKMLAARPYARKLVKLVQHLAGAADGGNPLFEVREVQKRLYVVIVSDKGLCGSYNMNIIKAAQKAVDASVADGVETALLTIGKKAGDYFTRRGYTVVKRHDDFNGEATAQRGHEIGNVVVDGFLDGTYDEVRVVYAEFISTMSQRPADNLVLPIAPDEAADDEAGDHDDDGSSLDYIWEPGQAQLFDTLLPLYLRNRVFMTLMEAFTSEHAARMTSMTAATENAGELIENLTLQRNRERQAAITAELLDIVGGANAL
jgi:F-type H+-transporting ATPase subunit gamma